MTQVTTDDVLKLAKLSGLKLDHEEVEPLRGKIEAVLGYVRQLDELELDDVEPSYQVTGLSNVTRADEPKDGPVSKQELLGLAPRSSDDYVEVPKVL